MDRAVLLSILLLLGLRPLIQGQALGDRKNPAAQTDHKAGVTVEKVGTNSEAEKAELQEGDVLLAWSCRAAKGEVDSPFDVTRIEIDQAPRGAVMLTGLRGAEKRTWSPGPGEWGLKTRPNLPPDLLSVYQEGQELAKAGNLIEAAERWRAAAGKVNASATPRLRLWLLLHAADTLAVGRQWKEADAAYEDVIQKSAGAGLEIRMHLLRNWAKAFEQRADSASAEKYYQQAAEEYQKAGSENLVLADILDSLGLSALRHADLTTAEKSYAHAMEIRQRLAPSSLSLANTLYGLGNLARTHGDLTKAEEYLRQALELQERLAPNSLPVAATLDRLGVVALLCKIR
jgi:tetratricopeptide (TPR) repeat protein